MYNTSYIELSQQALQNNIEFLQKQLGEGTRYSMVVKANAYGHGIEDLIPMIEDCDVDHFSVFSVAEAQRVYNVKQDKCDIMVMGWIGGEPEIRWLIDNEVSFFVFTLSRLKKVCGIAREMDQPARIHLEVETGMHRTGLYQNELEEAVDIIKENPDCFEIEGLCTHYAGAESFGNYDRILNQIEEYNKKCSWLFEQGLQPKYRHTACSAAVLMFPETIMDMVRIGISNYGFWPSTEVKMNNVLMKDKPKNPLERVLTWKSEIMSLQEVPEGNYVSYGDSYRTNRDSKVATVPVGYGYGFSRSLSNLGHVLVKGKRVRVIGTVNMNMMLIDVTDIKHIEEGDEVVLIGSQGDETISVSSLGQMTDYLNYELLTRLPHHIPRYKVE